MIRAIIYDMDGLMIDSEEISERATKETIERYGHRFEDIPRKTADSVLGMRVIDVLKVYKDVLNMKVDIGEFVKSRNDHFMDLIIEDLKAMPGLQKSLDLFRKNDLKIGLASSAVKEYISLVLEKLDIKSYFDVIVSGDDVTKGKPAPEIYLKAAKKLGTRPEECLVLEDGEKGIISAKEAGCRCIAVHNPNNPPQDQSRADMIVSSLAEIDMDVIRSYD